MAEIVRPPPAGTKEVVNVQPSLSISAARSMFESSKNDQSNADFNSPKRRQLRNNWATQGGRDNPTVVKEGTYVENNGVVRPPSAGTKETPDYQLESNALKARAAIFQQGKGNEYKPKNRIQKEEKKPVAEVVNRGGEETAAADEPVISIDQKAARSVFENPQTETTSSPRTVNDIVRASNMNAAKGVFTGENQAANQDSSSPSSSEDEQEAEQPVQVEEEKVVEEVKEVAAAPEAATFEIAPIVEPVEPEPVEPEPVVAEPAVPEPVVEEKEVEAPPAAVEDEVSPPSSSSSEADSIEVAQANQEIIEQADHVEQLSEDEASQ